MKNLDHKGDGKTHTVRIRAASLTYWGKGVATGYKDADRVVVTSSYGGAYPSMEFKLPSEVPALLNVLGLMDECYTHGKRSAKAELRRWLEIQ